MPLDCPLSKVYTLVSPMLISHCCRITRRTLPPILPISMHAAPHIDVPVRIPNCDSNLLSAPVVHFIDAAKVISASKFNTVSCLLNIISHQLSLDKFSPVIVAFSCRITRALNVSMLRAPEIAFRMSSPLLP
ncbi:hypothetical protein SADUNF_Sadunf16G0275500 [Salix dunnii]|uniref:Uncharacterized protein n=1 Tax=Salix dunnii TaxID=1413687 RepID=A0A835JDN6_9ROSI|nr:hypothetical protein SADUNF_Sadunf16G0275500 [Salix dunnii]